MDLQSSKVIAIVLAPLIPADPKQEPLDAIPVPSAWVRGALVAVALGLLAVFAVAGWLNPYDLQGRPLRLASHRQLGLPPCTFYLWTGGLPCPSCGMTTSFALLIHGDIWNSLKANAVGTLLALFWLALIPWSIACALRARLYFVVSLERALTKLVCLFLILLLVRWAIVAVDFWLRRQ